MLWHGTAEAFSKNVYYNMSVLYRREDWVVVFTFPVPPSPTRTSLKVGTLPLASAMVAVSCGGVCGVNCAKSGKGEMSAAVGESSARIGRGAGGRTSLVESGEERDGLSGGAMKRLF